MNRRQEVREYEDFVPSTGWQREPKYDTLVVYLSGFKKEQLKVQVTTLRNLRVSGERELGNNKWSRFSLEFPIPANYETNEITAKFEGGSLYIKHPKIITAEDPKPQQQIEEPKAKEEKATTQTVHAETSMEKLKAGEEEATRQKVPSKTSMEKQKSKEEKASAQEVPPKASSEKQPVEKANGVATNSADDLSHKEAKAKSLEKKKSEDLAGEDENISGDHDQSAIVSRMDKPGLERLSQVGGGGLVTMMKQTRKSLNFVMALLLALAVRIYNCARNAIRLIGKSNN
ncbi:hypothetical protein Ddye_022673 [Dipteronia dyeriana]|uniref:SHSP domain-containing protein n=1 Tax=Dipteronia dyeriana TaxID=168575 RepID=A0AAD9TRI2_9ROSI|nr:hypothetical protein Ddye_022673 [Dipteronia dyeriana]